MCAHGLVLGDRFGRRRMFGMLFGTFGSIVLLSPYFQTAKGIAI